LHLAIGAYVHQSGQLRGAYAEPAIDLEDGMRRPDLDFCPRWIARTIAAPLALVLLICATAPRGWCANVWLAQHFDEAALFFTPSELSESGAPTPNGIFDIAATGLAFDKSKNLWIVVNFAEVEEFSAAQLKHLGTDDTPSPVAVITSSSTFQELLGCAFDKKGNLWLADVLAGTLDEVSKAQLASGTADITPANVITSSDLSPGGPDFITFDKSGNAWVDNETDSKIVEFTASQLKSGGTQAGNVVITNDGSDSLNFPGEPAFDNKGNLWVANYHGQNVVEFTKKQIKASGSLTPAVILTDNGGSLEGPWGAVFDGGDLLISNFDGASISKFSPNQLKSSGAPVPPVFLEDEAKESYQLIFGP
jgi:hypothetical protein